MKRFVRWVAVGVTVASLSAACSSQSSSTVAPVGPATSGSSTDHPMGGTDTSASGASTLREGLSTLLQEHVYLASIATNTAITDGATSSSYKAAANALDANSVALSQAIGSVYGDAGAKTFLALWRKHIGFFVNYTLGVATHNAKMAKQAQSDLDGYRADFGAFLESATGGILTKDAVATELLPHIQTLSAVIAAQAAGKPWYALASTAAMHMPHTADVIAGAIVQQYPDKFTS